MPSHFFPVAKRHCHLIKSLRDKATGYLTKFHLLLHFLFQHSTTRNAVFVSSLYFRYGQKPEKTLNTSFGHFEAIKFSYNIQLAKLCNVSLCDIGGDVLDQLGIESVEAPITSFLSSRLNKVLFNWPYSQQHQWKVQGPAAPVCLYYFDMFFLLPRLLCVRSCLEHSGWSAQRLYTVCSMCQWTIAVLSLVLDLLGEGPQL